MTNLIIFTDTLTAIEVFCGDDIKYVQTFSTWTLLLDTLGQYMSQYASVEVRSRSPKSGLFSVGGQYETN
jgi:hypothetical protein